MFGGQTVTLGFSLAPGESKVAHAGWTAGSSGEPYQLVLTVDGTLVDTLDIELPFVVAAGARASTADLFEGAEGITAPTER